MICLRMAGAGMKGLWWETNFQFYTLLLLHHNQRTLLSSLSLTSLVVYTERLSVPTLILSDGQTYLPGIILKMSQIPSSGWWRWKARPRWSVRLPTFSVAPAVAKEVMHHQAFICHWKGQFAHTPCHLGKADFLVRKPPQTDILLRVFLLSLHDECIIKLIR